MQINFFDKNDRIAGKVHRQAFSGATLKALLEKESGVNLDSCLDKNGVIHFDSLCEIGIKLVGREKFIQLKNKSVKKQFAANFLWAYLKKKFGVSVIIPFVTGYWSKSALRGNLVVNTGHKHYADQAGGTATTPAIAIAHGTGTNAAAAGDTALQTEVQRGAATVTNRTTTTTGDTERWVITLTAAGTQAITEEGILTNSTSGGILVARQVFPAVNMLVNDAIQYTHDIQS